MEVIKARDNKKITYTFSAKDCIALLDFIDRTISRASPHSSSVGSRQSCFPHSSSNKISRNGFFTPTEPVAGLPMPHPSAITHNTPELP